MVVDEDLEHDRKERRFLAYDMVMHNNQPLVYRPWMVGGHGCARAWLSGWVSMHAWVWAYALAEACRPFVCCKASVAFDMLPCNLRLPCLHVHTPAGAV